MTKLEAALKKELREQGKLLKLVARELGKLREAFADQAGAVERLKAESLDHKKKLKMLIGDPLYAVPQETVRRVEELEARMKKAFAKLTEKAAQDDLENVKQSIAGLDTRLEHAEEQGNDDHQRIDELEESSTAPSIDKPAAVTKPDSPKVDARQTTLDEGIERAKEAEEEKAGLTDPDEMAPPKTEGDVQNAETVT